MHLSPSLPPRDPRWVYDDPSGVPEPLPEPRRLPRELPVPRPAPALPKAA